MKQNIQEIASGLYRISIPLSVLDFVHTYALVEGARVVLVDTAPNSPEIKAQYGKALAAVGKSLKDVDRILITHSHVDHCGLAGVIKDLSGARIHMTEIEYEALRQQQQRKRLMAAFAMRHGLDDKAVRNLELMLELFAAATAPFSPDHFLTDREVLTAGGKKIVVYAVPGHTRGQVCFHLPEEEILLSGDHVLPHITPNLSPDLVDPSFSPLESYLRSLDRIGGLKVKTVWPSHGEPFGDLEGRVEEIKAHHEQRKCLIGEALLGRPKSLVEISEQIFGGSLDDFSRVLALNETYVHLQQLEREGTATAFEHKGSILYKRA
jgi:glyoxylase-like metal-dependent hydrolase (beta-lactamase superfamily II)